MDAAELLEVARTGTLYDVLRIASDASASAVKKAYREQAWKDAIARCDLFSELKSAELDHISQATKVVQCKPGECLYAEGDAILPGSLFYLVHSGTFSATLRSPGGGEWVAREYGPLDNFGACELLTTHAQYPPRQGLKPRSSAHAPLTGQRSRPCGKQSSATLGARRRSRSTRPRRTRPSRRHRRRWPAGGCVGGST